MRDITAAFDRRKFLKRAGITGAVVRATPGHCDGSASPGPRRRPATTSRRRPRGPDALAAADAAAQLAARGPATHTPCYQACMEQRATKDRDAQRSFFTCVESATGNQGQPSACANQFRDQLRQAMNGSRQCTKQCS